LGLQVEFYEKLTLALNYFVDFVHFIHYDAFHRLSN
jgi:hypothetical protein